MRIVGFEGGVEDRWIVIVPVAGGIDGPPGGEWEVVLLNEGVRGECFFMDHWRPGTGRGECGWEEVEVSEWNRPARRVLFLQYVLACLLGGGEEGVGGLGLRGNCRVRRCGVRMLRRWGI